MGIWTSKCPHPVDVLAVLVVLEVQPTTECKTSNPWDATTRPLGWPYCWTILQFLRPQQSVTIAWSDKLPHCFGSTGIHPFSWNKLLKIFFRFSCFRECSRFIFRCVSGRFHGRSPIWDVHPMDVLPYGMLTHTDIHPCIFFFILFHTSFSTEMWGSTIPYPRPGV